MQLSLILLVTHASYLTIAENQAAPEMLEFLNSTNCGQSVGCWFSPPNCEQSGDGGEFLPCNEMVKWTDHGYDAVKIELEGETKGVGRPFMGHYIAVAFSHDDRMGDDYVLECVGNPSGKVSAYLSFNDGTNNYRLYNASGEQITQQFGAIRNGRIICEVILQLKPNSRIPKAEAWKVFDLSEKEYTLQFARGEAKPQASIWNDLADQLHIHWLIDGDLFPFISLEKVSMGSQSKIKWITDMKHYDVPRSVQYQLTVVHGIFMLFGWWVFGAAALLFARYFKPLWPSKTMLGVKVWFQMHRGLFIVSLVLQCIAFGFIFIQAGVFKFCTHKCDQKDYALYLHTVLGVACTAAALIQPFMAWIRPSKDNQLYKVFVWCHWSFGTGAWIMAAVVIFLAPTLGKTGLRRNFGFNVDYLMAAYICSFIVATLVLEILVQLSEKPKRRTAGKSELPNTLLGPAKEMGRPIGQQITNQPQYAMIRVATLVIFVLISICICTGLSYQLLYNLKKKHIL